MPGRLNVSLHPLLDRLDVVRAILQIIPDILGLATRDKIRFRGFAGLALDRPATVLDTGGEVVGAAVGFGVFQVEILGCRGGFVGVESVRRNLLANLLQQGRVRFTEREGMDTYGCMPVTSPA